MAGWIIIQLIIGFFIGILIQMRKSHTTNYTNSSSVRDFELEKDDQDFWDSIKL